jgi:ribonuclease HI
MQGQFRKKSNLDLWARLDQVSAKHHIQWNWTRGHADHPVHNECDRAARAIAKDEVQKNAVLERAVRNVIALQRASI